MPAFLFHPVSAFRSEASLNKAVVHYLALSTLSTHDPIPTPHLAGPGIRLDGYWHCALIGVQQKGTSCPE